MNFGASSAYEPRASGSLDHIGAGSADTEGSHVWSSHRPGSKFLITFSQVSPVHTPWLASGNFAREVAL
ncbi:hypothetical protein EUGRSUZ_H00102 [Eucalyptus grandis]|uniref:Uncharacterized protein n=2 Tax=Eucalyptus grandis TaxID=71139 RepID=A0ACC3JKJ8_EUCGR|nr:hypothetical protein EUGRSUZ_H00102 [Eucalyptus grandis]